MSRTAFGDRLHAAVLAHRQINDAPRSLALAIAEDVDDRGRFEMDRDGYARRLGIYRTRVDERVKALREAGLIAPLRGPAPNRLPLWVATIPTQRTPVVPVHERAPVEPVHVGSALPVHVDDRRTPVEPVHVSPANRTTHTGRAGARPIETPDQDDPVATGAHTPPSAAAQTNYADPLTPSLPSSPDHDGTAAAAHTPTADVLALEGDHQRRAPREASIEEVRR